MSRKVGVSRRDWCPFQSDNILGRKSNSCVPCGGCSTCTHVVGGLVVTKLKANSKDLKCSWCEHGRVKKRCAEGDCPQVKVSLVCPHGKTCKADCYSCQTRCPHDKAKQNCTKCTPARLNYVPISCAHNKLRCTIPKCMTEAAPRKRGPRKMGILGAAKKGQVTMPT